MTISKYYFLSWGETGFVQQYESTAKDFLENRCLNRGCGGEETVDGLCLSGDSIFHRKTISVSLNSESSSRLDCVC